MEKPSFTGRLLPSDFISESPTRSRGDRGRARYRVGKIPSKGLLNLEPSLHPPHRKPASDNRKPAVRAGACPPWARDMTRSDVGDVVLILAIAAMVAAMSSGSCGSCPSFSWHPITAVVSRPRGPPRSASRPRVGPKVAARIGPHLGWSKFYEFSKRLFHVFICKIPIPGRQE